MASIFVLSPHCRHRGQVSRKSLLLIMQVLRLRPGAPRAADAKAVRRADKIERIGELRPAQMAISDAPAAQQ
jgi:hypothetical protein